MHNISPGASRRTQPVSSTMFIWLMVFREIRDIYCKNRMKINEMHGTMHTDLLSKQVVHIPYILESNPHPFYSFRGLKKNQTGITIACGLDSRSWAGFWKNGRAAVRAVRTIQYNNLLFYLLFIILDNILYNIYNLLFVTLTVIYMNERSI